VLKTSPWNSANENRHHDNTRCVRGSEIPKHNREVGTGGKPLCDHCKRLNAEQK
jgi:hypothetical protein